MTLGKLLAWGHHPCFLKSPVDWDREGATMAKIGHWVEDTIPTMAQDSENSTNIILSGGPVLHQEVTLGHPM